MFGSLKLGRMLGIDVFVHGTFWLLPLLVLFGGSADPALDLAVLFGAFGCVALHEFGHAVAASWYGIRTRDITLYPIGGVARLEGMPNRPLPEIVVALAGPAVNVGIAAALFAVLAVGAVPGLTSGPLGSVLAELLQINVMLVLFNLIPAFPMDGGRVLRAGLHVFTDRVSATRAAAFVGTVSAAVMFLVGLFAPLPMLAVVAVFVFLMGQAELAQVERDARRPRADRWEAADEWEPEPVYRPAPPRVTVARPVDGWQFDAARHAWVEYRGGFPVRFWPAG